MKILLVDNPTCGYCGDGAILRGLIDSLQSAREDQTIEAISLYPTCSSYLLYQDIQQAPLSRHDRTAASRLPGSIERKIANQTISHSVGALANSWIKALANFVFARVGIPINSGTPAITINDQPPSPWAMKPPGVPLMATDVQSLMAGTLSGKVQQVLNDDDNVKQKIDTAVARERGIGNRITVEILNVLG